MEVITVPQAEVHRLQHLHPYASPAEKARNQLILIGSVFAMGLGLRVGGVGWLATLGGAAIGGLVLGMVVLEVWERAIGQRSAGRPSEDRLPGATAALLTDLAGAEPGESARSREIDGVACRVGVHTDGDAAPPPEELPERPPRAGLPLPHRGTRYEGPGASNGVAVVPGAWVRIDARTAPDPLEADPLDLRGDADALTGEALPLALRDALARSGSTRALHKALRRWAPWGGHLRVWPSALVLTVPFTESIDGATVARAEAALARWQAARQG